MCVGGALWDLALRVVMLDSNKCFDLLPHGVLLAALERLGLAVEVLGPLRLIFISVTYSCYLKSAGRWARPFSEPMAECREMR